MMIGDNVMRTPELSTSRGESYLHVGPKKKTGQNPGKGIHLEQGSLALTLLHLLNRPQYDPRPSH
jgi:hypothetical protein